MYATTIPIWDGEQSTYVSYSNTPKIPMLISHALSLMEEACDKHDNG